MVLKPSPSNDILKDSDDKRIKGPVSYDTVINMRVELRGIRAKLRAMMAKAGELDDQINEFQEKFEALQKEA